MALEHARAEHCMHCGSTTMENLLYHRRGDPLQVYVRCGRCKAFVARYTVERYCSNERFPDLLRMLGKVGTDSSRRLMEELEGFDERVQEQFARVQRLVEEAEDQRRIEVILAAEEEGEGSQGTGSGPA